MALPADWIPASNVVNASFATGPPATRILESIYGAGSQFVGAFQASNDEQPAWARRVAKYLDDQFLRECPFRTRLTSDVLGRAREDMREATPAGAYPNHRYALDLWNSGHRQGPEPYTCQQDYGSCVDASCSEHEAALLAYRIVVQKKPERWVWSPAWYKYANRGYCQDGWNGSGIALVASQVGAAFRCRYSIGGNTVDFTDDDTNERIVARDWCRSGIPAWLVDHTRNNHFYEDGAITAWDIDQRDTESCKRALKQVLSAGAAIHTSGYFTSGSNRPFTVSRIGAHMQSCVGCDDSNEYRTFLSSKGLQPRTADFAVIMMQTWGAGWRGEISDAYWPEWWGPKPQGAWVWWASDLLQYLSLDYTWMPWLKGFPGEEPLPPPPGPDVPQVAGELNVIPATVKLDGRITINGWPFVPEEKPGTQGIYELKFKGPF